MVAAGVPTSRTDHAHALAGMALDMLEYSRGGPLEFRLGINSGPVVAGVIGRTKFQYDVWGDTVNTASRMESHGVPGRIQISEATLRLVEPDFVCTPRGPVEVKGKGVLHTWFLEGRASSEVPDLHRRPHLSTRKRY
jgi:adenylate cyclase